MTCKTFSASGSRLWSIPVLDFRELLASPVDHLRSPLSPPPTHPQRHFEGHINDRCQPALTASNGIFDTGIRAAEKDASDQTFTTPDFAYLDHGSEPGLTARWHLWIANPGRIASADRFRHRQFQAHHGYRRPVMSQIVWKMDLRNR